MRTKSGRGFTDRFCNLTKKNGVAAATPKIQLKQFMMKTLLFQQFIECRAHEVRVRLEHGLEYLALILAQFYLAF